MAGYHLSLGRHQPWRRQLFIDLVLLFSPGYDAVIQPVGADGLPEFLKGQIVDILLLPDDALSHQHGGLLQQGLLIYPETLDEAIFGILTVTDKITHSANHFLCLFGLLPAAGQLLQAA